MAWDNGGVKDRVDAAVLWFRALTVASVFFFLGVAGHVTADGRLPGLAVLATFFTMSVLLSVPLLSRPASAARLVAMVVGGQTVLHVALSVTAGHRGDVTAPAPSAFSPTSATGALPVVDGRRVGSLQDAFDPMAGTDALAAGLPVGHLVEDLRSHATMMTAHLAVAVVVGLWLAVGERALWTLLALAGRRFAPRLVVHRPAHLPVRVSPVPVHLPVRTTVWLAGPQSRRGPPLRAA